jgi:hypothetical protein
MAFGGQQEATLGTTNSISQKIKTRRKMNYNDFIKALSDLHNDAEFCLTDVSERISIGDKTIEFLITEEGGYEKIGRRGGRNTYRTRVYVSYPSIQGSRIEVSDISRAGLDKATIGCWGESIHEMFVFNPALFEGAYVSLKQKVVVVGESSKALLEAALGEEITKLITARLQGEDVSADIRKMLHQHIQQIITDKVAPEVKIAAMGTAVTKLGIKKDADFIWDFEREDDGDFNLRIRWKSLQYGYQARNQNVWLMNQEAQDFCVRDAFLFSVNLPTFSVQIASTIERVSGM